ncbi:MAG TPA: hypothetical protein VKU40_04905, partial [Thermoanaerobaculia bacterium]|nr:hypothetical protein [Thermoanaerobaculia bacterium]
EVGYFVSQSKGYVWLGRGLARQGFGDAVDALVPSRLDDFSVDLSFRQWHAGGMRPESFACLLAQGLTLDGYLAADLEQIDPARPQGHLMTLSPSCQAEPERQWDFGLQLFKWVPLSFSGDGIAECVRPVTRRYKTHPTQGPFEGGSEPKPGFVLLRERLDCGPTAN